jgi:uncharacterized protein (DUF608 family)
MSRAFNSPYDEGHDAFIAYPLGGIGAGMLCLEGTGAISHVSLWHGPLVNYEPPLLAAIHVKGPDGGRSRVLEGQVPDRKIYRVANAANGHPGRTYGLPRFERSRFSDRFPFGRVALEDDGFPLSAVVTGWSPFLPGNADASSLPVAALEYTLHNPTAAPCEAIFSFHVPASLAGPEGSVGENRTTCVEKGFTVEHRPKDGNEAQHAWLGVATDADGAAVDSQWFRGEWFDTLTMVWNRIEDGVLRDTPPFKGGGDTPGSSLWVPLSLAPGETRTVRVRISWYVPRSALVFPVPEAKAPSCGCAGGCSGEAPATYRPWYASRFEGIRDVMRHWSSEYDALRESSVQFSDCFYASTLPPEVMEAVAANLSILKSPTMLREADGALWCWEGCYDEAGCCAGSCTHVWNYAQSVPHLFPDLERSLREVEFSECQDGEGHQNFRASLPLSETGHDFHAASDGQLGGILKVYRDWRISGDTDWMRGLWPSVRSSLEFCIRQWDPKETGVLTEPHHNTYDIEFWGPDGMCSSFYVAALAAARRMAEALGEDGTRYSDLAAKGKRYLEGELFNGEYFFQEVRRTSERKIEAKGYYGLVESPEERQLIEAEGPKYQYGTGCLSDGVLGVWMAAVCQCPDPVLYPLAVRSHLDSIHRYNLKKDLSRHANPQRPSFAMGHEGGLLLCTWPRGGKPSLPFVYSDEVWTGIEYQVASHLILAGRVDEGLQVVRACRERYDGRKRNPFDEYECGHWYARAMSSYALLQSIGGAVYDAVERTLSLKPKIAGDFSCFLATASGYGLAGVREGKPFLDVASGSIPVTNWIYEPFIPVDV